MTRPPGDVERVRRLLATGMPIAEAARQVGISRATVRDWVQRGFEGLIAQRTAAKIASTCDPCPKLAGLREEPYAYLLGLYLGDGCISAHARGVYRLRIALDARYPQIIDECRIAMGIVLPNVVNLVKAPGMLEVGAYSKHWPCLFPQHGPGPKHHRPILLESWQRQIAIERYPKSFLRGLMQSDGCTATNRIKRILGPGPIRLYSYRRYQFSNRSGDIRSLFAEACEAVGIECRLSNAWTVSISKKSSVAIMDGFVGPKL